MNRTLVSHSYYENIPISFLNALYGIVESELKAAALGVKTIDEALVSIEERGQQQLDKQLAEKSNKEDK
ncbi:hypothetical protein D3C73_651520 [compost metagenome]